MNMLSLTHRLYGLDIDSNLSDDGSSSSSYTGSRRRYARQKRKQEERQNKKNERRREQRQKESHKKLIDLKDEMAQAHDLPFIWLKMVTQGHFTTKGMDCIECFTKTGQCGNMVFLACNPDPDTTLKGWLDVFVVMKLWPKADGSFLWFNTSSLVHLDKLKKALSLLGRIVSFNEEYVCMGERIFSLRTGELVPEDAPELDSPTYVLYRVPYVDMKPPHRFVRELFGLQNWSYPAMYLRLWFVGWYLAGAHRRDDDRFLQRFVYDVGKSGSGKGVLYSLFDRFSKAIPHSMEGTDASDDNGFWLQNAARTQPSRLFLNEYRHPTSSRANPTHRALLTIASGEDITVRVKHLAQDRLIKGGSMALWLNSNCQFCVPSNTARETRDAIRRRMVVYSHTVKAETTVRDYQRVLWEEEFGRILAMTTRLYQTTRFPFALSAEMYLHRAVAVGDLDILDLYIRSCFREDPTSSVSALQFNAEFRAMCNRLCVFDEVEQPFDVVRKRGEDLPFNDSVGFVGRGKKKIQGLALREGLAAMTTVDAYIALVTDPEKRADIHRMINPTDEPLLTLADVPQQIIDFFDEAFGASTTSAQAMELESPVPLSGAGIGSGASPGPLWDP